CSGHLNAAARAKVPLPGRGRSVNGASDAPGLAAAIPAISGYQGAMRPAGGTAAAAASYRGWLGGFRSGAARCGLGSLARVPCPFRCGGPCGPQLARAIEDRVRDRDEVRVDAPEVAHDVEMQPARFDALDLARLHPVEMAQHGTLLHPPEPVLARHQHAG